MTLRGRLFGGAACVALAGIVAFNPLLAHAQGVGVIAFQGNTTSLTPVPWVGTPASASYTFNTHVVAGVSLCAELGVDVDGDGALPEAGTCGISSSGTYTNIVCGTGTATGSASVTGPEGYGINYTITFVAGLGVLLGSGADTDGGNNGTDVGIVDIAPNTDNHAVAPPPTSNACVTDFLATGVALTAAA